MTGVKSKTTLRLDNLSPKTDDGSRSPAAGGNWFAQQVRAARGFLGRAANTQELSNVNTWLSTQLGKFLVIAGVLMVGIGLLLLGSPKLPSVGLGKLPGDIAYKGKTVTFYFPVVTCLVLSLVLTLVFWLISFFSRR